MFGIITNNFDTVPVCDDCGCFTPTSILVKNYDNQALYCVPCFESDIEPEEWREMCERYERKMARA